MTRIITMCGLQRGYEDMLLCRLANESLIEIAFKRREVCPPSTATHHRSTLRGTSHPANANAFEDDHRQGFWRG
jgi:hypothetical protein